MRRLISYQTIAAAKKGDGEAMASILRHYTNYISYYSKREYIDSYGNLHSDINEDIRQEIEARLVIAIVSHFDHISLPEGETLEG